MEGEKRHYKRFMVFGCGDYDKSDWAADMEGSFDDLESAKNYIESTLRSKRYKFPHYEIFDRIKAVVYEVEGTEGNYT